MYDLPKKQVVFWSIYNKKIEKASNVKNVGYNKKIKKYINIQLKF